MLKRHLVAGWNKHRISINVLCEVLMLQHKSPELHFQVITEGEEQTLCPKKKKKNYFIYFIPLPFLKLKSVGS